MQIQEIQTQPLGSQDTEHILAVRGLDRFGVKKAWLVAGVVQLIEIGEVVFTQVGNQRTAVEVYHRNGRKFIRSKANVSTKDNLLSLPRF